MTFEFCSYDIESCPYEEFCSCKEFENEAEDMDDFDPDDNALPF